VAEIDPRYINLMCCNCGEPGHFVGIYEKLKLCFICAIPDDYMNDCSRWKESKPTTSYFVLFWECRVWFRLLSHRIA
jgi:hypothetical protein